MAFAAPPLLTKSSFFPSNSFTFAGILFQVSRFCLLLTIADKPCLLLTVRFFSSGVRLFHIPLACAASAIVINALVSNFAFFSIHWMFCHPPAACIASDTFSLALVETSPVFGSYTRAFHASDASFPSLDISSVYLATRPLVFLTVFACSCIFLEISP